MVQSIDECFELSCNFFNSKKRFCKIKLPFGYNITIDSYWYIRYAGVVMEEVTVLETYVRLQIKDLCRFHSADIQTTKGGLYGICKCCASLENWV